MNIQQTLLIWIEGVTHDSNRGSLISGFQFDDRHIGFGHDDKRAFSGELRYLTSDAETQSHGIVAVEHHMRRGFVHRLEGLVPRSFPGLLTDDVSLKCVWFGTVGVSSDDPTLDISYHLGVPTPLVGDRWIGVVEHSERQYKLAAFGNEPLSPSVTYKAFDPWMSDSIDDAKGLVFTISLM